MAESCYHAVIHLAVIMVVVGLQVHPSSRRQAPHLISRTTQATFGQISIAGARSGGFPNNLALPHCQLSLKRKVQAASSQKKPFPHLASSWHLEVSFAGTVLDAAERERRV